MVATVAVTLVMNVPGAIGPPLTPLPMSAATNLASVDVIVLVPASHVTSSRYRLAVCSTTATIGRPDLPPVNVAGCDSVAVVQARVHPAGASAMMNVPPLNTE